MRPVRTRLAAAALGAGLVIAAPAVAWAGPRRPVSTVSPTDAADSARRDIEEVRARCLTAIDLRLPVLAAARDRVAANRHVTDDHRAALTANIEETAARLRVLAEAIKTDADLTALREHCRSIFEDNRVFALVLPRAHLVVGADTATDAGAKLRNVAGKLSEAIDRAEAAGQDVTQARMDLNAMKAAIASGVASAGTVPGAVLGLTPADWNADHEVLTPARQSLRSARADLKVARDLAQKIRTGLTSAGSAGV
jgi:hypothetical protein